MRKELNNENLETVAGGRYVINGTNFFHKFISF